MSETAVQDGLTAETTVRLAASGDEAAFARLVADHHRQMLRVAYVIAGDAETAADAVQAAWTIAWRRLNSVRDAGQIGAWLVAVAANEARQAIRRQRRRTVVQLSVAIDDAADGDPADAIRTVDLERALRRVKPEDRALLALRFVGGLDSTEIASQLGISASGVRTRLARLLDRLRADLDHE